MWTQVPLTKSSSRTLEVLDNLDTWERVQAQAVGDPKVTGLVGARVESHYPVRVCNASSENVVFRVDGAALGFTPVVICGLASHDWPASSGLWTKAEGA